MKRLFYFLAIVFSVISCKKNSYEIVLKIDKPLKTNGSFQIFFDKAFIGESKDNGSDKLIQFTNISIPDSIKIPRDSKFAIGYVDFFKSRGVRVLPGQRTDSFISGDTAAGVSIDQIVLDVENTDSLIVEKIIGIMKHLNTVKKDSIPD